jgi:hypothetical protein
VTDKLRFGMCVKTSSKLPMWSKINRHPSGLQLVSDSTCYQKERDYGRGYVQVHIFFALHTNTNRLSDAVSQNDIIKSLINNHVSSSGYSCLYVRNVLVDRYAALHANS